jgi:phosphatidylinositol dimannoside acyltransferase
LLELVEVATVFANYASCLTEALLLGSDRGYKLTSQSRGVDNYYASAAEGRGVIIATAHTGGWEVAGPVLSNVHPADVVVVMQRERDPRARAIQDEARARAGVKVVHVGDSPFDALALIGHLRKRSVVAMQIDRVPPGVRRRNVSLFGAPWELPEGPLSLAALSGAPLLPVFTRRIGFMEYEAIIAPPIKLPRRPSDAELQGAADKLAFAFEDFLRLYPTQWFHFV